MIPLPPSYPALANYLTWIAFEGGQGDIVLGASVRAWTPDAGWVICGQERKTVSAPSQTDWVEITFRFPLEIPENPRFFNLWFQRFGELPEDTYPYRVFTPGGFFWYSPQSG